MGHPQCPGTVAKPPNSRSPTGFLPVYLLAAGEAERTRRTGDKQRCRPMRGLYNFRLASVLLRTRRAARGNEAVERDLRQRGTTC